MFTMSQSAEGPRKKPLRRDSDRTDACEESPSSVHFEPDPERWARLDDEALLDSGPARVVEVQPGLFRGAAAGRKRGEVLLLTDSLPLVLELRQALLDENYDLTWTNNFWLAMSYLQERQFAGLVLDMRVDSVEERFVVQFIEEYDQHSQGKRIVLGAAALSPAARRSNEKMGQLLYPHSASGCDLIRALELLAPGRKTSS